MRRPAGSENSIPLTIIIYNLHYPVDTVLRVSTQLGEQMDFFGLTDPWIIGGYVGSFLCVAFCVIYGFLKGRGSEEDEEDGQ